MSNRREEIRLLYMGGQAAIASELVIVITVFMLTLLGSSVSMIDLHTALPYDSYLTLVDNFTHNKLFFSSFILLVALAPTIVMMITVWAWHLYFASEGVRLMNWVATSFALIGAALIFVASSLNTLGFAMLVDGIEQGPLSKSQGYIGYIIVTAVFLFGILALYVIYPMFLALASWRKRILPLWFIAFALVTGFINDLVFVASLSDIRVISVARLLMIIWPFLMGYVMLRKAQTLAVQDYEETHGVPPPHTRWRDLIHSTPTTDTVVFDE